MGFIMVFIDSRNAMDFFGFRNVLKAAMDAENLALAQEEATLTKIRTLLNQHKVGGE